MSVPCGSLRDGDHSVPPFSQGWQMWEEREKQMWDGQGLDTDGKRCGLGLETARTGLSMGTRSAGEGEEQEGNKAKEAGGPGGEESLWEKRGRSSGWKGLRGMDVADGLCFGDGAGRLGTDLTFCSSRHGVLEQKKKRRGLEVKLRGWKKQV